MGLVSHHRHGDGGVGREGEETVTLKLTET